MRIMMILLFCSIALGCSGMKAALNAGTSLAFGQGLGTSLGVSTSLSGNDKNFGSSGIDINGSDASKDFSDLNTHFNNIQNLTQKANGNITQPTNVAYSYFEVMDFFYGSVNNNNINSRDENGKTPLVVAIEQNNLEMVEFLVSKNAQVSQEAITAAKSGNNSQILQFLEQ